MTSPRASTRLAVLGLRFRRLRRQWTTGSAAHAFIMRRRLFLAYPVALALLILVGDYLTGVSLRLTDVYALPVALAAWFCGHRPGLALAVALPAARLLLATVALRLPAPGGLGSVAIQVAGLGILAYLVARAAAQTREVRALRGLLPICLTCHRIRDADGNWEDFEQYVLHHTSARLTHGYCPQCEAKWMEEIEAAKTR